MSEPWERRFKTREIAANEWEEKREHIERLYIHEDRKLKDVRRTLAEGCGFYAKFVFAPPPPPPSKTPFPLLVLQVLVGLFARISG